MKKLFFAVLFLLSTSLGVVAQQAIELKGSLGQSLTTAQMKSLEKVATAIQPNFKIGKSFHIYDCSFYTFNDEMGPEQEAEVWSNFQKEADQLGQNYLLLGRQLTTGNSGFKLWIKLNVNAEDLECYDSEFDKEIQDKIAEYQVNLEEWYEYLSFKPEANNFDIESQVAELGSFKLEKVCCDIESTRNDCNNDRLDPQQIENEKNLKYFILGRLRCLFDSHDCSGPIDVSNDNALNAITESSLVESQSSRFWQGSDILEEFSFVHIYISTNNTNTVSCNITPDNTQTRNWFVENDVINDVEVSVYDLGKFTIVTKREIDLFAVLNQISTELSNDLESIIINLTKKKPLKDSHTNLLKFASLCDFLSLKKEEHKYELLKLIVSETSAEWYEFWKRWSGEIYPVFVRQLYDSLGEDNGSGFLNKKKFFEYQAESDNLEFAKELLDYDFPYAMRREFYKDYCQDWYKSSVEITENPFSIKANGQSLDSIFHIPYQVNTFLNFYETNFSFKQNKTSGEIDIQKKIISFEYHGNSQGPNDIWVDYQSEKPFNPVLLARINIDEFQALSGTLPAIILPRIQDFIDDENFLNGIMLSVDVVTTLSVIGNVTKFRHLYRAGHYGKIFFTGSEIVSTVAGQMVTYLDLIESPEMKRDVQLVLLAIEVAAAFGNSLSPGDIKKIQDKAREVSQDLKGTGLETNKEIAKNLGKWIGGKNELLDRIYAITKNEDGIYDYVKGLDAANNAIDALKIERLNILSEKALFEIIGQSNADISIFSKFTDDIANAGNGKALALFFNAKPKGVKAWKKVFKEDDVVSDILRKDILTLKWFSKHGDDIPQSAADDLLDAIDKPIKETIEDAQGRLTYVLDRPGQSNKAVSVHPTSSGQFKTTTFNRAYNPDLNPNIPVPLSTNMLVPDYINTSYMHPLQGTEVVKIKLSGNRNTDFARARAELEISSADETVNGVSYTWHHMDDFEIINGEAYSTMQLVKSSAHQGTGVTGMQHSGSAAQWRAYNGSGY